MQLSLNKTNIIIFFILLTYSASYSNNTLEKYISQTSWLLSIKKAITDLQNAYKEYAKYKSLLQLANIYKIKRENMEENFDNLDENFDEREEMVYKKKANTHMHRTILYGIEGILTIGFCIKKSTQINSKQLFIKN